MSKNTDKKDKVEDDLFIHYIDKKTGKQRKMPKNGNRFKKGESGNPNGRPAIPQDVRHMKKLTVEEFQKIIMRFLWLPVEDVDKINANRKSLVIDALMASIITRAINEGCIQRMGFLMDRLLGKMSINMPVHIHQGADQEPVFMVEMNEDGKFMRSRPREITVEASEVN